MPKRQRFQKFYCNVWGMIFDGGVSECYWDFSSEYFKYLGLNHYLLLLKTSKCNQAFMILCVRSQIRQITEWLFHQYGLFNIFHGTRYGMNRFFNFRFEITIYGKIQNQINQNAITSYWRKSGILFKVKI